jgi:hypothetical protein
MCLLSARTAWFVMNDIPFSVYKGLWSPRRNGTPHRFAPRHAILVRAFVTLGAIVSQLKR